MFPWRDRTGRFSPLKAAAFSGVLLPAFWIAIEAWLGWLGSRPVTEAIHQSGLWSVRLLALSLAVTPLRLALRSTKLISIRRILGVSVFAYAALHFALYILDQHFNLAVVASEIVSRFYLTLGFIGFCGLCALAATSTDAMIARLGSARWNRLQQSVYTITALAVVHFFMQAKADVSEPILMGGIFATLGLYRLAQRTLGDLSIWQAGVVSALGALATMLTEAFWYAYSVGAPFERVLSANLDFSYSIRPVWFVLAAGSVLVVARALRPFIGPAKPLPRRLRTGAGTIGHLS